MELDCSALRVVATKQAYLYLYVGLFGLGEGSALRGVESIGFKQREETNDDGEGVLATRSGCSASSERVLKWVDVAAKVGYARKKQYPCSKVSLNRAV